jgi:hypothetical protein
MYLLDFIIEIYYNARAYKRQKFLLEVSTGKPCGVYGYSQN